MSDIDYKLSWDKFVVSFNMYVHGGLVQGMRFCHCFTIGFGIMPNLSFTREAIALFHMNSYSTISNGYLSHVLNEDVQGDMTKLPFMMYQWLNDKGLEEVFIVLHWFRPESGGIRAIPRIPEESNLAEEPAKLNKWFRRNFEQNSNSTGMVPGITRKEWIPGRQQNGICSPFHNAQPCPNWSSEFADDQFGCGQQSQTLLSHHHHHPQCHLRRRLVTITSTHHHPQSSPAALSDHNTPQHHTNKTRTPHHRSRTRRPRHVTESTSAEQVPRRCGWRGNQTTNDNVCCHLSSFISC